VAKHPSGSCMGGWQGPGEVRWINFHQQGNSFVSLQPIRHHSSLLQAIVSVFRRTLAAARCNPVIRAFYQRLVACMRKLIVILNAILKHRTAWNPNLCPQT